VFASTSKGRHALCDALTDEKWASQRERPPFLTWLALSWQAKPETFRQQLGRRRDFLELELAREQETLRSVREEVGHDFHEAIWMLRLIIGQFRTELRWLRKLEGEAGQRAPAKHPSLVAAR
jgi:hypothetical protein